MSAPAGDVADRLEKLAAQAPTGDVDPDVLWARGRRRQQGRWAVAVAGVAAVVGLVGLSVTPLARLAEPHVAVSPDSAQVLPDVVRQPGGWEPAFGPAPGRLSAVGTGTRSGWLSSSTALWGVSSSTGESRWLELPVAQDAAGEAVLSSDGTRLAYWTSAGDAGRRTDGQAPVPTGVNVLDLTTGEERRWDPATDHGLMATGMAWAGDTLWFQSGPFRDAEQSSARVDLWTWGPADEPERVTDPTAAKVTLTTVSQGVTGFLAVDGTAARRGRQVSGSGQVSRIVFATEGALGTPVLSADGRRVAGIEQGRREQTYGVDRPLLVGDVAGGRARLQGVGPVAAEQVLGWRSSTEVVVAAAEERDGDRAGARQVSVVRVGDPADVRSSALLDVQGNVPTFAASAWSAQVVPAPDAPFAPDPRQVAFLVGFGIVIAMSVWRSVRSRRGHP